MCTHEIIDCGNAFALTLGQSFEAKMGMPMRQNINNTWLFAVLGSLLFKSNQLHITLYFEDDLYITVAYYLETKVTIIY